MIKQLIAGVLICSQIFTPLTANANLLENIISGVVQSVVTGSQQQPDSGNSTSGQFLSGTKNNGLLVFSDNDPLVFDPSNDASAKRVTQQYIDVKRQIESKQVLEMQDLVRYGNALRPYINYLEHVERVRSGGDLTLQPGQSVNIETGAFCIDPGIPAPAHNSELMLVKNTNLLPPQAIPIYEGLMRYSIQKPQERAQIQNIVHDLRNLQTAPAYLVGGIGESKMAYMDKVMPNGGKMLQEYAKANAQKARLGQQRELQTIQESQRNWNPQNNLTQGVSATVRDVGGNAQATMMTVTNHTSKPFTFNPVDYSGVPATAGKQRIGIAGATNIVGANGKPMIIDKQVELVEALVDDAKEILGKKSVAFGTTSIAAIPAKNAAVRTLFKAAPLAGTMIAAWELHSGHDFFTGNELSSAEKVITAMSLVPGAGTITRLLGDSARHVVAAANASRQVQRVGEAMTRQTVEFYGSGVYGAPIATNAAEQLARQALVEFRDDQNTNTNIRNMIPADIQL